MGWDCSRRRRTPARTATDCRRCRRGACSVPDHGGWADEIVAVQAAIDGLILRDVAPIPGVRRGDGVGAGLKVRDQAAVTERHREVERIRFDVAGGGTAEAAYAYVHRHRRTQPDLADAED